MGVTSLRDIVLAFLNGIYEGDAAGERFRMRGKTDICIEDNKRAAFIAECKVWRGAKEIEEAVDQLLDYHTWRDCKSALVIFDKDVAGFSSLGPKLERALVEHPNYVRSHPCDDAGEWRIMCHSEHDPEHSIAVHVFFLNLYTKKTAQRTRR